LEKDKEETVFYKEKNSANSKVMVNKHDEYLASETI
jgi:hypothetical protein